MVSVGPSIPALPVGDVSTAVAHFRDRLKFTPIHLDDGFAVLGRDGARVHLWQAADRSWSERDDLRERPVRSGAESFLAGPGPRAAESRPTTSTASTPSSRPPMYCTRSRTTA